MRAPLSSPPLFLSPPCDAPQCVYPASRQTERDAIYEWCATIRASPQLLPESGARPRDPLTTEQRVSFAASFDAANVAGDGCLTLRELTKCVGGKRGGGVGGRCAGGGGQY